MARHLARMTQQVVEGEVVAVTLELIHDMAQVHVNEGDRFFTVGMAVDPWEVDRG